jgi:predicted helicase
VFFSKLSDSSGNKLNYTEPNFYFVKKNFEGENEYEKGFKVDKLFLINTSGIKTHNDSNLINLNKFDINNQKYFYRPFDIQNINYDLKKVVRHRYSVMKHLLNENISILFPRQAVTERYGFFISKGLTDINYTGTAGQFGAGLVFPLYLYPETTAQQTLDGNTERTPNLDPEIVKQIAEGLGIAFVPEKTTLSEFKTLTGFDTNKELPKTFAPIDLLDYIYAVLHSPTYREKYKEFLKIDFPRVPFPHHVGTGRDLSQSNERTGRDLSVLDIQNNFWKLVQLGGELRQIHLLESPIVEKYITQYSEDGDNVVVKPRYEINPVRVLNSDRVVGKVHINETQYFENVPEVAWNFYIGGYQPAQKWLKDRKERELSYEDILHYQKIIVALSETDRIMKEIDGIEI